MPRSENRGYTLIEMSVVIAVVGMLMASFVSAYHVYLKNKISQATDLHASMTVSALGNFLIQNGRYPCPARIDAQRGDPDYGVETQCDPNPATQNPALGAYPAAVPGTFAGGLWFEQGMTQVDIDPGPGVTMVTPTVRRGAVPFRTLGLPEDRTEDGYKNRLNYAVTEILAVTATYDRGNGAIQVNGTQNQTVFSQGSGLLMRPDSNITQNNITNGFDSINETPINDANYAYSSNSTASVFVVGLSNPIGTPFATGPVTVRYRIAKTNNGAVTSTGNAAAVNVSITDSAGVILASGVSGVPTGTWTQYSFTFDASLVPDWNTARLRIQHPPGPGAAANKRGSAISWAEIEAPGVRPDFKHYFLFSSGRDQAGAYTRYGNQVRPCPVGTLDAENCDTTAQAIYRMAEYSEADVPTHFDDYVKLNISIETPLWRLSGASGAHIRDLLGVETTGGRVGIGQNPDLANVAIVQVGGEVRAKNANALVSEVCDTSAANCFSPERFGSGHADFQCSPANGGSFAIGFEDGKIRCSDTQRVGCLPGQFITGVLPDGTLECETVVGCPPHNISMCGGSVTHTIPAGVQGQVYTTPVAGFNYQRTYTCGPNPWWQYTSQTGICNCTPVDETYTAACPNPNGGFYTGVVTYHHVHTCPDDNDTTTQIANTCLCTNDGATETYTDFAACPSGFSGSITYERTWNCVTATQGQWSNYVVAPDGNNCTCNATSQTQNLSCPPAYSGTWEQQRDFQCPAGTWTGWYDTTNTCNCNDGQTQTQSVGCPAGWTGFKTEQRTYSCATDSWSSWSVIDNQCTCTPATETQTLSCPTAYSGGVQQERHFTCPGATWGSWSTVNNTCACTGASQTRTIGCTAPLAGTKDQQRDYDCGTDSWGSWYDTADNCVIVTYNWVPKTPAEGPYASPLSNKAGNTCPTVGAKEPCSALAGGGLGHWHYAECQCE